MFPMTFSINLWNVAGTPKIFLRNPLKLIEPKQAYVSGLVLILICHFDLKVMSKKDNHLLPIRHSKALSILQVSRHSASQTVFEITKIFLNISELVNPQS